jgi:cytochrome P450
MTEQLSDLLRYPPETWSCLDADPELRRYLAEGTVPRVRLATGREAYLALRHEDVRQVLADPRFSRAAAMGPDTPSLVPVTTQGPPGMIFNMDPPDHTRLRRLVSKAFTHRRVEELRPRVQAVVDGLLDAMAEQGPPADMVTMLARPLPATVICEMLGIPDEDRPRLGGFLDVVMSAGQQTPEEMAAGFQASTECLLELVERKRRQPDDDLLSALVQAHDGTDRLTEHELLMTVLALFGGGLETMSTHLPFSLLTLFRRPDQLALLVDRPDLVPNAAEELLRYIPMGPASFPRVATVDVEVGGVTIPAGQTVFPVHAAANRDPATFADPDRVDITRTEASAHVMFGHGMHHCLGAALARQELQVALGSLLRRFPALRLAVPEAELDFDADHMLGRLRALPVAW